MLYDEFARPVAAPGPRDQHRVVTLAGPRVSLFELAVPCEVFGIFRPEIEAWPYVHEVVSTGGALTAGNGLTLQTAGGLDRVAAADTLVVAPIPVANLSRQGEVQVDPELAEAVHAAHAAGTRIVSLCSGAFILAQAGLLDGRRATTHWMYAEQLAERFPTIEVDPTVLWVEDHPIYTSAGTAAAIDLCLHLVRDDLGAEAANRVARRMVVPPHRDGGQAQFVDTPVPDHPADDPLGPVLTWMAQHVDQQLTVEQTGPPGHAVAPHLRPPVRGHDRDDPAPVAADPAGRPGPDAAGDHRPARRADRPAVRLRHRGGPPHPLLPGRGHRPHPVPGSLRHRAGRLTGIVR